MKRNRTGTGTLGAFGCCRKHHSTHVLERHRKHPQMGKPSDVVLQLSAVACPWKQFCFGFGLLSRCRPADSWWSPDPREQVKKKGDPQTKARRQRCKSRAPRRDLPDCRKRGARPDRGVIDRNPLFPSLCRGVVRPPSGLRSQSVRKGRCDCEPTPPFDGWHPPGTSRRAEECGGLDSGSSGSEHGGVAAVGNK